MAERLQLLVADRCNRGDRHVEGVEPRIAFDLHKAHRAQRDDGAQQSGNQYGAVNQAALHRISPCECSGHYGLRQTSSQPLERGNLQSQQLQRTTSSRKALPFPICQFDLRAASVNASFAPPCDAIVRAGKPCSPVAVVENGPIARGNSPAAGLAYTPEKSAKPTGSLYWL